MLRCWSCNQQFAQKIVLRDALLEARDESKGGPLHVYHCPHCQRDSKIETTPRGRLFASPHKDISTVEYLFSWIEPLTPEDFLKIVQWHELNAERRAAFFSHDGDHRYQKKSLFGFLRHLRRRRPEEPPREATTSDSDQKPREKATSGPAAQPRSPGPGKSHGPRRSHGSAPGPTPPLPHPYRILGVSRDATEDEIRDAFRKLARTWHPDKVDQSDPAALEEANRRLKELLKAYEALRKDSTS